MVADPLGKLYNKDAVIEFLLDRTSYGDGEQICGYLKGVKDLLTLNLTENPEFSPSTASTTSQTPRHTPFVCPLSLREMNGAVPFIALRHCGCVFSDASVRAIIPSLTRGLFQKPKSDEVPDEAKPVAGEAKVVACPNCTKEFDPTLPSSVLAINPPKDVQDDLLDNLLVARATAKSGKKRKAAAVEGVKVDGEAKEAKKEKKEKEAKAARSGSGTPVPGVPHNTAPHNSLARSVHQKLAEQEQKRLQAQAGMSDAVKAMFKSKEDKDERRDHADFFGRTFTRYAA